MRLDYALFMAEAEHQLPHSTSKINNVIRDLRNIKNMGLDPNNYTDTILTKYKLTQNSLTDMEVNKIIKEVERR